MDGATSFLGSLVGFIALNVFYEVIISSAFFANGLFDLGA